jgi:hypothetical protein
MNVRRCLLAGACAVSLPMLSGCLDALSSEDASADFFAATAFSGGPGYQVQGWGWKPNTHVSVDMWNEPDGPGSASTEWKHLFNVDVDQNGMFGFTSNSAVYPVRRTICGNPEQGQTAVFMVKSIDTNRLRMRRFPVDIYFTFQPCK